MAHARNDSRFSAIRIEGGLLPPDYLHTISALEAKRQTNTDYGLTKSLHLKDEIGRYWRIATDLWSDYQEHLKRAAVDPIRVAVDGWLRPFFAHVLGYQDLAPCTPITISERRFPLGYQACRGTV